MLVASPVPPVSIADRGKGEAHSSQKGCLGRYYGRLLRGLAMSGPCAGKTVRDGRRSRGGQGGGAQGGDRYQTSLPRKSAYRYHIIVVGNVGVDYTLLLCTVFAFRQEVSYVTVHLPF